MSPRGFIGFAIVTGIALLAAIVLVIVQQIAVSGDRRGGGLMFAELAERVDEVSTITIVSPNYSLTAERQADGAWVATDRGAYPVSSDPLDFVLSGLSELIEYERKTDTEALFADLGVAGPAEGRDDVQITVTANDGDVLVDAIFGYNAQSIGRHTRGGMFVRRVNEDHAWLAEGTARAPTFITEFYGMLFSIPGPSVGRVSVFEGETLLLDAVKIDFATADYQLAYLDPTIGPEGATAADSSLRSLSQVIVSTTFVDVRLREEVNVPDDARMMRFITQDGLSLSITLGDVDGTPFVIYEVDAAPGSPGEEQAAAIAAVTEGFAFQLQGGRIVTLTRPIEDLFDPPELPAPEPEPAPAAPLVPVPAPDP